MKALIVDDSKAMRMIIKRILRQAGFDQIVAEEASNGNEALGLIQASRPDILFLDWNMPEMGGMELVEALKQSGTNITFGFVTSEGTPEMKQKAAEAGAVFFISKPFTLETFQEALNGVLS